MVPRSLFGTFPEQVSFLFVILSSFTLARLKTFRRPSVFPPSAISNRPVQQDQVILLHLIRLPSSAHLDNLITIDNEQVRSLSHFYPAGPTTHAHLPDHLAVHLPAHLPAHIPAYLPTQLPPLSEVPNLTHSQPHVRENELEALESRGDRIPFVGTYGVNSMLSENVRQARHFSVPALAEPTLLGENSTQLGNFSYSPLSSDEALLPSLSPAQPMLPPLIKARIRAARRAKKANKSKKTLRLGEARAKGKISKIREAKSKGMKGFLKRTVGKEPLYRGAFP